MQKVYVAKLRGIIDDESIERLAAPLEIDGKTTQPAGVRRLRVEGDKTWVEFTLHEGRNRQIHRITEAAGTAVFRLARVLYAGLDAEGLRPGQWRYLTKDELKTFKADFGQPKKLVAPPPQPDAEKLERTRKRLEKVGEGQREERKRLARRAEDRTAETSAVDEAKPVVRARSSAARDSKGERSRAGTRRGATGPRANTPRSVRPDRETRGRKPSKARRR